MIQLTNFLNAMAKEVDLDKIEAPKMPEKGPEGGHKTPMIFEPMRRKMHIPGSEQ